MTDVSAWDPVDDNNNAAPPAGWPEGMMPSGVNNSARAMMGAVRREHDRIVGQIGSTPGEVTAAVGYTTRAGVAAAPQANVFNLDWTVSNGVHLWIDTVDQGQIATQTQLNAYLPLSGGAMSGPLSVPTLTVAGTLTAAQLTSTGNINAAADIGGRNVIVSNVTASSTVLAAQLTSSGNANISGTVTAGAANVSGALNAHGVAGFDTNVTIGGTLGVTGDVSLGGRFAITGGHVVCYSTVWPGSDGVQNCGEGGHSWAGVSSYNFVNASDPELKQNISPVPGGCLDLVCAIAPKTYRWRRGEGSVLDDRTHWGFLSTDVAGAMQRAKHDFGGVVTQNGVGGLVVSELVAVLWRAVQELSAQTDAQAARIAALEG